jgi:uncharacterized protein (TIGR02466 family)
MTIEHLFSVPVYYSHFSDTEQNYKKISKEIQAALASKKYQNLYSPWDDTVLSSFSDSEFEPVLESLPTLKNYIINHVVEYVSNITGNTILDNRIDITESWLNISPRGGFQNYHTHGADREVSGVYYYQTSELDGDIKFKTDSSALLHSKIKFPRYVTYKPEEGKLLLFPSLLEHAVLVNKTHSDRISISFNVRIL